MSEIMTKDRKCVQCGEAVVEFAGEPGDQVADPGGWLVPLSMWYTLKPCGHTFKVATGLVP
jgi:hypothetical protein